MKRFKNLEELALTWPIFCGYIPIAIVFGVMVVQQQLPWWVALFSGLFIYAGAAQFMMLKMLALKSSLAEISIAAIVLNSRHIFYGLSLLGKIKISDLKGFYSVFALTDETYAIVSSEKVKLPGKIFNISILNHLYWVTGCLIGGLLGSQINFRLNGFDLIINFMFIVLTIEIFLSHKKLAMPALGILLSVLCAYYFGSNFLFLSLLMSVGLIMIEGFIFKWKI